jgi:hypothetical protein
MVHPQEPEGQMKAMACFKKRIVSQGVFLYIKFQGSSV